MAVLKYSIGFFILLLHLQIAQAGPIFTKEQFLSLKDFNSQKLLNDEKETDYRVLYFWATWCPDCKEKITGDLATVASAKAQVYAVATDKDSEKIKDYLKANKVLVPVLEDNEKRFQKLAKVFAVPTVIVFKKVGSNYEQVFEKSGAGADEIRAQVQ